MSKNSTSTDERDRFGMTPEDWKRLDALTDEEIIAAAEADPDAYLITPEQVAAWRPPALSKVVRHQIGMTRLRFSETYAIPLDTLRAWERHELEPTQAEVANLELIAREPEMAKRKQPEPAS
jgi:putative transcriptional regulator